MAKSQQISGAEPILSKRESDTINFIENARDRLKYAIEGCLFSHGIYFHICVPDYLSEISRYLKFFDSLSNQIKVIKTVFQLSEDVGTVRAEDKTKVMKAIYEIESACAENRGSIYGLKDADTSLLLAISSQPQEPSYKIFWLGMVGALFSITEPIFGILSIASIAIILFKKIVFEKSELDALGRISSARSIVTALMKTQVSPVPEGRAQVGTRRATVRCIVISVLTVLAIIGWIFSSINSPPSTNAGQPTQAQKVNQEGPPKKQEINTEQTENHENSKINSDDLSRHVIGVTTDDSYGHVESDVNGVNAKSSSVTDVNVKISSGIEFSDWEFLPPSNENIYCSMVSENRNFGKNISIKSEPSGAFFVIELYDDKWNRATGDRVDLTISFSNGYKMLLPAYADYNVLDAQLPFDKSEKFINGLKNEDTMKIGFQEGGESTWVLDKSNTEDTLNKLESCLQSH